MNQLSKAITSEAARFEPTDLDDPMPVEVQAMQKAAKAWAASALETFRGDVLAKALAISAAMADFTAQYVYDLPKVK